MGAMNKVFKISLVAWALSSSPLLFAEQEVGNGGDIVYCENGGHSTYELLDHWEAREYYGLHPILDDLEGDYLARAGYVVEQVKANFPKMGEYLTEQLNAFNDNARFVDGAEIILVPDAHPRMLPRGCVLKQIANQREPQFPGEKVFLIDNQLWEHLTPGNQAALVLHEIIYRYALRDRMHKNSIKSRYLVGFLAQKQYAHQPEHLQVFASRQVFGNDACFAKRYFKFGDFAIYCAGQDLAFHPTGNVKIGYLYSDKQNQPVIANMRQTRISTEYASGAASFSLNGDLEAYHGVLDAKLAGDRVFRTGGRSHFYKNAARSLKDGNIYSLAPAVLLTTAGDERVFQFEDFISLNEAGYVIVP